MRKGLLIFCPDLQSLFLMVILCNMMISDYHVHSSFSPDAVAGMESMVRAAISMGLEEILFTEHYEFFSTGEPTKAFSGPYYLERIIVEAERLKKKYAGVIRIGCGLEIGQWQYAFKNISVILDSYDWDFILASYHKVNDIDLKMHDYRKENTDALLHIYLSGLLEISQHCNFDSLAHIDLIRRYAYMQGVDVRIEKEEAMVRRILRTIVQRGRMLEVNTSAYRQGLNEPFPSRTILEWYQQEGGRLVTLGSDAHCENDIARDFDRASALIESVKLTVAVQYHRKERWTV